MGTLSKNQLVAAAIIILLAAGGIYYWYMGRTSTPTADTLSDAATEGASVLPRGGGEAVPEVNPVQQANPFSNTYKNPFE